MYLKNGLIVQKDNCGGDTAQREGFYAITQPLVDVQKLSYELAIRKLEPNKDGNWIRNPDTHPDPNDFTRDQQTPNILAMGINKLIRPLYRMFKAQVKRFGLTQRKELVSPEFINLYIRSFAYSNILLKIALAVTYPILLIGDLFTLLNTLNIVYWRSREVGKIRKFLGDKVHWIFKQGEPSNHEGVPQDVYGAGNVGVDLNHLVILRSTEIYPTPISFLAKYIYFKYRPSYKWSYENDTEKAYIDDSQIGAAYALDRYFRPETGGNPELAVAWKPFINKIKQRYNL